MSQRSAFRKISNIIDNKIWGCLADATASVHRYDKYLDWKHKTYSIMEYWSDKEVQLFKDKLNECFNQDIVIMKKDKMNDLMKKIKEVVRGNLNRL